MKYFGRWLGMCLATWIMAQFYDITFGEAAEAMYWVGVTLLMCWWFDGRKSRAATPAE